MKLMSIIRLMLGLFLAICFQQVVFASDNAMVRTIALGKNSPAARSEKLTQDIANATTKMNNARKQLLGSKTQTEDRKNVGIIILQNSIIVRADHNLKELSEQLEKQLAGSETQKGYLEGLKDIGSSILGQVQSIYAYAEDEKEIARQIIDGLKNQKAEITREWVVKLKGALAPSQKSQLKMRYEAMLAQFNTEIHKQQVITGEAMSFGTKVAWGTLGAAAATAAGLAFADKYFATTSDEIVEAPSQPLPLPTPLPQQPTPLPQQPTPLPQQPPTPLPQQPAPLPLQPASSPQQPAPLPQQSVQLEEQRSQQRPEDIKQQDKQDKQPIEQSKEATSAEPEKQLQSADEFLIAANEALERAREHGPSPREEKRVKIAEFIKKKLDESPNDPEALDYLNQLKLADEKVAQLEEKNNEYRKRARRIKDRQPEGKAIVEELKAAKKAEADVCNKIFAEIKAKSVQQQRPKDTKRQDIKQPIEQSKEAASAEPKEQSVLQQADEFLVAANKKLEQAQEHGPSSREEKRVKIAEFIKKRLDESPNDPEALDYLNQLKLADEKVAQLEEKDNEYSKRVGWFYYWFTRQPEGIAITQELKAAKKAEGSLLNKILSAIKDKEQVLEQQEKVLEAVNQNEQEIIKKNEVAVVEEKPQLSKQVPKQSKQQEWRIIPTVSKNI